MSWRFGVIFVNSKTIPQANIGALVRSLEKLARRYKQADLRNMVAWAPKA